MNGVAGKSIATGSVLCIALVALLTLTASTAKADPAMPEFYNPDPVEMAGPPGSVIRAEDADGLAALPAASRTWRVLYRSRSLTGALIAVSGTVAVPRGPVPAGGWPIVSWGHVTTGSADVCAPSAAAPGNPELERMVRGDEVVSRLLAAGVAVARTDGEGIGTPGPHPYLVGRSLARAQTEIVHAARLLNPGIGRRWAAAGHSEGGVGAVFTAQYARQFAPDLDLRAVAAAAPPTAMPSMIELLRRVPSANQFTATLTGLAGLIVAGASEAEPDLKPLLAGGALSGQANGMMAHVEQRCMNELSLPDSWGGLAPSQVPGPRFEEASELFYDTLRASDPRVARLGRVPVRIDQGMLDAVVLFPLADAMVAAQRLRGARIEYHRYPTATHADITDGHQAAPAIAGWLVKRLR